MYLFEWIFYLYLDFYDNLVFVICYYKEIFENGDYVDIFVESIVGILELICIEIFWKYVFEGLIY